MVEYKGKLYIGCSKAASTGGNQGPKIFTLEGTTLSLARDLSGVGPTPVGEGPSSGANALFVYDGTLYYHYRTGKFNGTDGEDFRIGKFDGTTWTDSFVYPLPSTIPAPNDVRENIANGIVVTYKGRVAFKTTLQGRNYFTNDLVTFTEYAVVPSNPLSCPRHTYAPRVVY
jgi:hypothetical protein